MDLPSHQRFIFFFYLKSKRDTQLIACDWFRCASTHPPPPPPTTHHPTFLSQVQEKRHHAFLSLPGCFVFKEALKFQSVAQLHTMFCFFFLNLKKNTWSDLFACKLMQISPVSFVFRHAGNGWRVRNVICEGRMGLSECFRDCWSAGSFSRLR